MEVEGGNKFQFLSEEVEGGGMEEYEKMDVMEVESLSVHG